MAIWVLARVGIVRALAWFQPYIPGSFETRLRYGAWLQRQVSRSMEMLGWKPNFDSIRPGLEESYSKDGTPLRWIHPMIVREAVILARIEVLEGTIVVGTQCDGHCFAYLEPNLAGKPVEPNMTMTGVA